MTEQAPAKSSSNKSEHAMANIHIRSITAADAAVAIFCGVIYLVWLLLRWLTH